jgi:hypothetical protein
MHSWVNIISNLYTTTKSSDFVSDFSERSRCLEANSKIAEMVIHELIFIFETHTVSVFFQII